MVKALKLKTTNASDAPSLINALRTLKYWSDNGDSHLVNTDYLCHLQDVGSVPSNLPGLFRLLRAAYKQRLIAETAHWLTHSVGKKLVADNEIEEAENRLLGLTSSLANLTDTALVNAGDVAEGLLVEEKRKRPVKTHIAQYDDFLGGLWPGDLVLLAGRPSCGKTALGLSIASNIAEDALVVFFSLEMSAEQLVQRLVSMESGVSLTHVRSGKWRKNEDEAEAVHKAVLAIQQKQLIISDSPCGVNDIRAHLMKLFCNTPPKLIVIDYLQLMPPEDKKLPREQQISSISRGLKLLCKSFSVPFLVISQLNRMATSDAPQLHHLRESGALEQDADMVLAISHADDKATIHVLKHRNGPIGQFETRWDASTTLFGD